MNLWMNEVHDQVNDGAVDEAIDSIYDHVEALLDARSFDAVDKVLMQAQPKSLGAEGVVALLIVTLGAKGDLPGRPIFIQRAWTLLDEEEEGAKTVTMGLL